MVIELDIKDKIVGEEKLALISHIGPPEEMGILIEEIAYWAEENQVKIIGPPFAIYYSNPQKVPPEEFKYDVGFPIQDEVTGTDKILIVSIPEHRVVYTVYKGPYANIDRVYDALVKFVLTHDYDVIGSPKEIYFNSPEEVAASELLTEVQFPVIKKG